MADNDELLYLMITNLSLTTIQNVEYGHFKLKIMKELVSFRLIKSIENTCKSLIMRNLQVKDHEVEFYTNH